MKRFAKFEMLREAEIAFSPFPVRKDCSDLFESKKKYASAKKNNFFPEVSMGLYPTSDPDSTVMPRGGAEAIETEPPPRVNRPKPIFPRNFDETTSKPAQNTQLDHFIIASWILS